MDDQKPAETTSTPQVPIAASADVIRLIYMPNPGDPETTEISGVKFAAYQAVELHPNHHHIAARVAKNPWFSAGEVNTDRQKLWDTVREAHAKAEEMRAHADGLTKAANEAGR